MVCTRGDRSRWAGLGHCLESLLAQNCAHCEILLVLNRTMDDAFRRAMAKYPVRLLSEPRPGVCAARNHAIPHAKGEILAFVDDDVTAHTNWLHELLEGFKDPLVACVTGRVVPEGPVPYSEEKIARYYAGERALSFWSLDASDPDGYVKALGDPVGFGCNMAFRKKFLETFALFPEDLGAGSLIGGGDEFYMFVQVLKHGFRIHHNASAVVTHYSEDKGANQKHRISQLYAGSSAFALKLFIEERGIRLATIHWVLSGLRRRLHRIRVRKKLSSEPQELLSTTEKIVAYLRGPWIYWKSRQARKLTVQKS